MINYKNGIPFLTDAAFVAQTPAYTRALADKLATSLGGTHTITDAGIRAITITAPAYSNLPAARQYLKWNNLPSNPLARIDTGREHIRILKNGVYLILATLVDADGGSTATSHEADLAIHRGGNPIFVGSDLQARVPWGRLHLSAVAGLTTQDTLTIAASAPAVHHLSSASLHLIYLGNNNV